MSTKHIEKREILSLLYKGYKNEHFEKMCRDGKISKDGMEFLMMQAAYGKNRELFDFLHNEMKITKRYNLLLNYFSK